jgi:hypothetical protein
VPLAAFRALGRLGGIWVIFSHWKFAGGGKWRYV